LYPKKEDIQRCPEIKTRVEKPQVKCGDVKEPLEDFIKKHMHGPEDLQVLKVTKDKTNLLALTNSNYCETIGGLHENVTMSYSIKGKEIVQKCPVCKKSKARKHCLTSNVLKVLKQK